MHSFQGIESVIGYLAQPTETSRESISLGHVPRLISNDQPTWQ